MTTLSFQSLPSSLSLYPKALINSYKAKKSTDLPDLKASLSAVSIDRQHLAAYNAVCGFGQGDVLPATYLHMLLFPLHMALMADESFPFALLGLVHISNSITQHRPVNAAEKVNLTCEFGELKPHDKGVQFALIGKAYVGNELVWSSESVYLRRQSTGAEAKSDKPKETKSAGTPDFNAIWEIPGDIGRQYGAVSGDRNPIHLYNFTAKLFGFPRAIAHGMWTKARCLAAYDGRLPAAFKVDVQFKLPVLLPAKVAFQSIPNGKGALFSVADVKSGKPHLAGSITAL
ncbi:MAG: MaoC/PaaZ C-terminal domain-containing protein [Fluviicoccus sp.]|uniref:MaoC family dehydratase n=1 Tax=Fluviicoccus sp. TaxID=2003552 RepID=UPI00272005C5|nr:MaoC/PaaZ C-terminal domain-containing protein [Fluviicoccus sp.]MDO8329263.1 MaoC/PaaZ C-terminal domain-containing protein [Fluviicoccus sp.]